MNVTPFGVKGGMDVKGIVGVTKEVMGGNEFLVVITKKEREDKLVIYVC